MSEPQAMQERKPTLTSTIEDRLQKQISSLENTLASSSELAHMIAESPPDDALRKEAERAERPANHIGRMNEKLDELDDLIIKARGIRNHLQEIVG